MRLSVRPLTATVVKSFSARLPIERLAGVERAVSTIRSLRPPRRGAAYFWSRRPSTRGVTDRGPFSARDKISAARTTAQTRLYCAAPMDLKQLREQIKALIIKELNLEGRRPEDIGDDMPLFGEGLKLDSIDALQLAVSIEEQFGVTIAEGDEARRVMRCVATLADHIATARGASATTQAG